VSRHGRLSARLRPSASRTRLWYMNRTEACRWRLSSRIKAGLEHEARRAGKSVSALLEEITGEWFRARREAAGDDAEEQARAHAAVSKTIGSLAGGDPSRSTRARTLIRQRLGRRRAVLAGRGRHVGRGRMRCRR